MDAMVALLCFVVAILVCVPKIRFYNIGGEGHRELGVT
jgi:hypothetical protein